MQQIGFIISLERRNKEIIEWIRPGVGYEYRTDEQGTSLPDGQ